MKGGWKKRYEEVTTEVFTMVDHLSFLVEYCVVTDHKLIAYEISGRIMSGGVVGEVFKHRARF